MFVSEGANVSQGQRGHCLGQLLLTLRRSGVDQRSRLKFVCVRDGGQRTSGSVLRIRLGCGSAHLRASNAGLRLRRLRLIAACEHRTIGIVLVRRRSFGLLCRGGIRSGRSGRFAKHRAIGIIVVYRLSLLVDRLQGCGRSGGRLISGPTQRRPARRGIRRCGRRSRGRRLRTAGLGCRCGLSWRGRLRLLGRFRSC